MKMTELFLAELEREAAGTRCTLQRVSEGCNDWKPHEKSMPLGYLAALVAKMPSWIALVIKQDGFCHPGKNERAGNQERIIAVAGGLSRRRARGAREHER